MTETMTDRSIGPDTGRVVRNELTHGTNSTRPTAARIELALHESNEVFLRRWGDTGWRGLIDGVQPSSDDRLLRLVRGVAAIEDDAFYMQVKLRQSGVLRSSAIQQYNAVWLTEEGDHGRAFAGLAARLHGTTDAVQMEHDTMSRDRRAMFALVALRLARVYRRGSLGGYLVRGAMVEHVAIAVYGSLMRQLRSAGEPAGAEIVRRILVQEGRHLRFFSHGAKVVLGSSPVAAALVRRATESTWRPPGVDLYGLERWTEVFHPVLQDAGFLSELVSVDVKVSEIPGFEGSCIVRRYMERLG